MAKHLKEIRLDYNFIDEQEESFIIRQITLNGAQITVAPKKQIPAAIEVVRQLVPGFLK